MDMIFNLWLGVVVISVTGTLLHFLYELSHKNKIVGFFAAVNESTWEHIKIALVPTFLWSLYDGFIYGSEPNYFIAKFFSLLILIFLIPLLFHLYKYFIKKDFLVLDIMIFYFSIILSQFIFYSVLLSFPLNQLLSYLSCIGIFVIFGLLLLFTIHPPKSPIFKDPITKKYGLNGHKDFFTHKKSNK